MPSNARQRKILLSRGRNTIHHKKLRTLYNCTIRPVLLPVSEELTLKDSLGFFRFVQCIILFHRQHTKIYAYLNKIRDF